MGIAVTPLKRPIHIGKRLAKNRFVIQPMECGDATCAAVFLRTRCGDTKNCCTAAQVWW